jgi:hypothetical protein
MSFLHILHMVLILAKALDLLILIVLFLIKPK